MDYRAPSQDWHPLPSETDGRTLVDYRPLQAPAGRQTGIWQNALDLWSLGLSKNYWSMCKKLKKGMEACGIEKQISYHCGRHSFATLALSKGMPIESVSRVLGHTNIVTTQIYAKITSQKLNADLTIEGGYVYAHATNNDGIDANGNCYIKGGVVFAIGASGAEVAIDANSEEQKKLYVTGGTLVAIGGLESGSSLTQSCYSASSWSKSTWYALYNGSDLALAFKTPSSGVTTLVVSTSGTTTLKSGVTVSGGTEYFGGAGNIGGTVSGGSSVTLSSYTGGNGPGGGDGPGGGGPGGHESL